MVHRRLTFRLFSRTITHSPRCEGSAGVCLGERLADASGAEKDSRKSLLALILYKVRMHVSSSAIFSVNLALSSHLLHTKLDRRAKRDHGHGNVNLVTYVWRRRSEFNPQRTGRIHNKRLELGTV